MVYSVLPQALRKAFLFPTDARQSVHASGACGKGLETNRLAGFCVEVMWQRKDKYCPLCKEIKPLSEFGNDRSRGDGKAYACKKCANARNVKWQREHFEKVLPYQRTWRAANKERIKERDHTPEKMEKMRERDRIQYANNKDKALAKWWNRRARKKANGGKITAQEWCDLKKKYNYTCLCCKRREPEIKLTLDHVLPIVMGGKNIIENAQPLCKSCNSSKNSKHIDYR